MEKTAKAVPAGDREKSRSDIEAHAADSALGDLCVCVREKKKTWRQMPQKPALRISAWTAAHTIDGGSTTEY